VSSRVSAPSTPNEGGSTQRANLNVDWRWKLDENQLVTVHTYGTYYELDLFNDFTFFLNDPQNGDEINQRDRRFMAGFDALLPVPDAPVRRQPDQLGRLPVPSSTRRAWCSPTPSSAISWRGHKTSRSSSSRTRRS
jgi:hypothetical protein